MSKRQEVECRRCGADCYWEDGTLYDQETDERHVCHDDVDDEFEEVDE
jgi:hypothetical protein